ncbi:MAG: exonuclease domain-containing protein [Sphingobacteriales bacterium]|jgi:DNA polymerase-3 subunit epsilon
MNLKLERDLVFFDLETTGVNIQDRIVELYAVRVKPDGSRKDIHHYIHPEMLIPEEATAIHGITNAMVADKPKFSELSLELSIFFKDADLAGFNIRRFDVPLLMEEFHRCGRYPILLRSCKVLDPFVVFLKKEPRNLAAALKFYCQEDHDDAHSAKADVEATMKVFEKQFEFYDDLGKSVSEVEAYVSEGYVGLDNKFRINKEGKVIFNFGKNIGKPIADDPDYLRWIYKESNMPIAVRTIAGDLWKQLIGE